MDNYGIPLHAYDLIDQLDSLYPEVVYDPTEGREAFLMRAGERRLVLALKARRAQEIEERRVLRKDPQD